MTKSEQYYVSKIANLSRKRCVDSEVIDENARKLEFKALQNIVNYFGGNLFKDKNSNSYFKIINNGTSFDICIGNDIKKEDESITILTALGIPFFDGDKLTIDRSGMKMEFKKSSHAEIDEILSRASKDK